jgi:uncharacterized protein (TIGR02266 family)
MQQSLATNEATEPRQRPRRASGGSELAPALRGGASGGSDTAPALRGGAPLLRVRCRCTSEQEFVQRYAADVCAGGMFLRTQRALPAGARVRFELLLQNGRCALGGVGRVAWVRETEREQQRPGGAGIAFERLRRGDRAVIERMDAVRGDLPSRFEQPDAPAFVRPAGPDLAKTLFADLGVRSDIEPGASAFLSADLSHELGEGGWQLGARASSAEHPIADLAEQLEPVSQSELEADEPEVDVELVARPATEPPTAHSTVRPSPANTAAPQSVSAVYAVSPDSAVSLALARNAVKVATGTHAPARSAASLRARVDRVSKPTRPVANPVPTRRGPMPVVAAPAPAVQAPTAVPAAQSQPSLSVTARVSTRRRASTLPLAAALTTVIVLAIAVTYLALTDQLGHVLRAIGL